MAALKDRVTILTVAIDEHPPAHPCLERPVFGIKRPFSNAWGIRDN
jgi:hypothetical protein